MFLTVKFCRNAFNTPLRDVPVRTAKAEKRRKERLLQEVCPCDVCAMCAFINPLSKKTFTMNLMVWQGILSDEEDKELSPAEQRALRAEKRAAWRQARFKSLEQVYYFICLHASETLKQIFTF